MRVRLEGDGTPSGTRVVDLKTGRAMIGVTSLEYRLNARDRYPPSMTLQMTECPVDVEASAIARIPCDCGVDGICPQGRRRSESGPCTIIKTKSFIEGEKT